MERYRPNTEADFTDYTDEEWGIDVPAHSTFYERVVRKCPVCRVAVLNLDRHIRLRHHWQSHSKLKFNKIEDCIRNILLIKLHKVPSKWHSSICKLNLFFCFYIKVPSDCIDSVLNYFFRCECESSISILYRWSIVNLRADDMSKAQGVLLHPSPSPLTIW